MIILFMADWAIDLGKYACLSIYVYDYMMSILVTGVDRLDKDLAIGQMQGKFQMQIVGQVGHAVHEDAPDKVGGYVYSHRIKKVFYPVATLSIALYVLRRSMSASDVAPEVSILSSAL